MSDQDLRRLLAVQLGADRMSTDDRPRFARVVLEDVGDAVAVIADALNAPHGPDTGAMRRTLHFLERIAELATELDDEAEDTAKGAA